MKLEVEIKKTHLLVLMFLCIGFISVYAYGTFNPSNFGHSAGEVIVTVDGSNMNLQDAINNGKFGSSGSSNVCPSGYNQYVDKDTGDVFCMIDNADEIFVTGYLGYWGYPFRVTARIVNGVPEIKISEKAAEACVTKKDKTILQCSGAYGLYSGDFVSLKNVQGYFQIRNANGDYIYNSYSLTPEGILIEGWFALDKNSQPRSSYLLKWSEGDIYPTSEGVLHLD